jgi:ABC-type lipoprotein export system ATPase subunit
MMLSTSPQPSPLSLKVTDLRKGYRTSRSELRAVIDVPGFEIATSKHIALRGGSGTGKTTFLNLIAGIVTADAGTILIDGQAMTGLSEPRRDRLRAQRLGYVFQVFNLLQGYSALENVLLAMSFGPGEDRARAEALLRRVGLQDRLHDKPASLSVGQQQRVAIARALANQPSLVLADEPTGNLDPENAAVALDLIREVCQENGAALLLVSHDSRTLERFETVHDLRDINRASAVMNTDVNQSAPGAPR